MVCINNSYSYVKGTSTVAYVYITSLRGGDRMDEYFINRGNVSTSWLHKNLDKS